jgi:WhiB family redox-sensing transcriptional regulator
MIPHHASRGNYPRATSGRNVYVLVSAVALWSAHGGYDTAADQRDWVDSAVCAQTDPDMFYPEGKGFTGAKAQAVCRTCPVMIQCLDWALEHDERFGVWGGMTGDERAQLRKAKR